MKMNWFSIVRPSGEKKYKNDPLLKQSGCVYVIILVLYDTHRHGEKGILSDALSTCIKVGHTESTVYERLNRQLYEYRAVDIIPLLILRPDTKTPFVRESDIHKMLKSHNIKIACGPKFTIPKEFYQVSSEVVNIVKFYGKKENLYFVLEKIIPGSETDGGDGIDDLIPTEKFEEMFNDEDVNEPICVQIMDLTDSLLPEEVKTIREKWGAV